MRKALVALAIAAAAVPMVLGVIELPRPGDPSAPALTHVAARYIESGAQEAGADNLVTGVLLNYRGLDTFGEVMVIFSALAAVMATLAGVPSAAVPRAVREAIPISPVVAYIIRLTAPFIALFGAYVIFKGHITPGGGFQGGVILGALLVLLSVVLGRGSATPLLPVSAARCLQAAGPVTFAVIGAAGLALTGALLGFPQDPALAHLRESMLIALEIGIGLGGAFIILGLFEVMRGD